MVPIRSGRTIVIALALSGCMYAGARAADATVQNAGFDTFIAASDSFPGWSFTKDPLNGAGYTITQETTGAHSAPGALKMAITAGADTATTCAISTDITGLPANKIVTITAWAKYSDMPTYWNGMISLQQATLLHQPPYTWTDRKWGSDWGNNLGTSDWAPITLASDTTVDGGNVFRIVVSLRYSGTLWIDDIAVTYTDLAPVLPRTVSRTSRESTILGNKITFSSPQRYSLDVCGVNGRLLLRKSGVAGSVDMNKLGLSNGTFLVRVKTEKKTFAGKVAVGR
jgi:hypothetical protein